jgi:hypothetical protein
MSVSAMLSACYIGPSGKIRVNIQSWATILLVCYCGYASRTAIHIARYRSQGGRAARAPYVGELARASFGRELLKAGETPALPGTSAVYVE